MQKGDKKANIYSALEVANICGVVNQTAVNWIKNGHLKAFMTPGKQYRVYSDDLIEFLASRGMRIPEELTQFLHAKLDLKKMIIVDDDTNVNNILKKILNERMAEYTILQAFDGYEAGRLISAHKPLVILLDILLPGLDGEKLCKQIKSDPELGDPIIIAITGIAEEGARENMLSIGADAYFAKPLEFDELMTTIKALVKKYVQE